MITVACVCAGTAGLFEACVCGMVGLLAACSCAGTAGLLVLLVVCDCGADGLLLHVLETRFASVVYNIVVSVFA